MAGIYLHIPFCKQACHYCNFHFSTSLHLQQDMIKAMQLELLLRKDYITEGIDTIYFGGGTPSILALDVLQKLMEAIFTNYTINDHAEITLEANPDDIDIESLQSWKLAGINRLSIGIQSFDDTELKWMNRAHSAAEALKCVQLAQHAGIENISIDLIYGSPLLSDEQWINHLETAIDLQVPHLSCYALTVENRTALHHQITQNKTPDTDPEKQSRHFGIMQTALEEAGYIQYEISNFCKPGAMSNHNSGYWKGIAYTGIGPSAHSYNGISRQWNIAHNKKYIDAMIAGNPLIEMERLTVVQQMNEYIMIRLRLIEGINLTEFEFKFGSPAKEYLITTAHSLHRNAHFKISENNIFLSPTGKFFADGIAANLFFDEGWS